MIRKHPFRFVLSIVGSFFVHVAAVFAMLMAVPEIAPTELFRPISVSLVPESSIPGTGIQLEEQTIDMGSEIPSNPATSTTPAETTTEVAEAQNRNEDIEYEVQSSSEIENESDAEPLEVVNSEPETDPEPVPLEREPVPLPEQTELSAELSESTGEKLLDDVPELNDMEELTNDAEPIARVHDPSESIQTLSKERIETDQDVENDLPIEFVGSSETGIDFAHAQDSVSNESEMSSINEEPAEIRATLVVRQTQAAPERAATDSENETIARVLPDAILDMADSQSVPLGSRHAKEEPEVPLKDIPISPTTAILVTDIEENQSKEIQRTAADIESELIARVFPDAIKDVINEHPAHIDVVKNRDSQEIQSVETQTPVVELTVLEPADPIRPNKPAILPASADMEQESIAWNFPDAIQDVIDEHPVHIDVAKNPDSQEIQPVETQTPVADLTVLEPADPIRPNEPAILPASTDMEQESIAWNFPDAIQDVIDEHAPASSFLASADHHKKPTRFEIDQPTVSESATIPSLNKIQSNRSLPPQFTADVEQELIARVFPNPIRDVVEEYPTRMEAYRTVDVPEVRPVEVHTQDSILPISETTKKRTVVDTADEVEIRFAYSEIDESIPFADAVETIEPPEKIESKVGSIAITASPQIVGENPSETEKLSSSRKITSQADLPHESEPVNPQPTLAKKIVEETESVESELSEQPPLERTQDSDAPLTKDNSVISETVQVAAIRSESETVGSTESADMAPQFGVPGLSNPAPKYPYMARANNEEGRVILRVYVDSYGNADKVETHTSSGFRRLDKAAKKAVRNWKFLPARTAGVVSDGIALVPVTFVLTN